MHNSQGKLDSFSVIPLGPRVQKRVITVLTERFAEPTSQHQVIKKCLHAVYMNQGSESKKPGGPG